MTLPRTHANKDAVGSSILTLFKHTPPPSPPSHPPPPPPHKKTQSRLDYNTDYIRNYELIAALSWADNVHATGDGWGWNFGYQCGSSPPYFTSACMCV
jgi:hypothetical protein